MNLLEIRFYPLEANKYRFKVSVEGASGEVHYEPVLPFLDGEIPEAQDRRFTVVKLLESIEFNRENFAEDERAWMVREQLLPSEESGFEPKQLLTTIGHKLYQVLGHKIQQVISTAVADTKRYGTWLHIRLRFPADDPKYIIRLTDYPWELLCNENGFLAHQKVAFSRYIAYGSPRPNLPSVEQLNVLLISSGASDQGMGLKPLPSDERGVIAQALQHAQQQGIIRLEILPTPTLAGLRSRLIESSTVGIPHVLHFDGHGFFGKRCNSSRCRKAHKQSAIKCSQCGAPLAPTQGYLVFEQPDGTADYVSAEELGELLGNLQHREQPNSESGITLAVLSSCRSGMSRLSDSVFNGVAQNLINRGIPSVVAMVYTISVRAARVFTEFFYQSLGQKNSLAIAVSLGKSAIGIEDNEWYRPMLYLRWEDNDGGQLFKDSVVQSHNVSQTSPNSLDKPTTKNQLISQTMKLNGEQRKKLREALISAFPREADLERLLADELGINLNTIASGGTYTDIVFRLIQDLEAKGRIQELMQAASKVNPGNPKLQEFVTEMHLAVSNNLLPEFDNPQNLKRKSLTERLAKLKQEYVLVNQQIDESIDEVIRRRLEYKAKRLFNEITQVELELDTL